MVVVLVVGLSIGVVILTLHRKRRGPTEDGHMVGLIDRRANTQIHNNINEEDI